ncbi:MAG TPA: 4-alpha-glucanotransferase [Longimicrobiaceae bacterium]
MNSSGARRSGLPLLDDGRLSGVLLHPTSLPAPGGVGNIGAAAHRFIEWLAAAGQSFWQILPLVDTDEGGSPYNGLSAVAGNTVLIDLQELVIEGLLDPGELEEDHPASDTVDYPAVMRQKGKLLGLAFRRLRSLPWHRLHLPLREYRARQAHWIEDYALFRSLRDRDGAPWTGWRPELRGRQADALRAAREELEEEIARCVFQQFLFDRQWAAVRTHAHENGIAIIGDIPIFVAHDSADVWAHQDLFRLDSDGHPTVVSGVPPDYFSKTGQRWGNPLFNWDVMRGSGYAWWIERFRRTLEWVDVVRIDHFRGFQAYWEIPAEEETAVHGAWKEGPGAEFFRAMQQRLGAVPVIAEDLGLITPEVDALRTELGYPGMRVVQFAFDGDPRNPHLPENYPEHTVAYTGTHDNDTIVGWWSTASPAEREVARQRWRSSELPVHEAFIDLVFRSPARIAIVPLQDVLGLGSEARMNTPGTSENNWTWRLREGQPGPEDAERLRRLTCDAGRCRDR